MTIGALGRPVKNSRRIKKLCRKIPRLRNKLIRAVTYRDIDAPRIASTTRTSSLQRLSISRYRFTSGTALLNCIKNSLADWRICHLCRLLLHFWEKPCDGVSRTVLGLSKCMHAPFLAIDGMNDYSVDSICQDEQFHGLKLRNMDKLLSYSALFKKIFIR